MDLKKPAYCPERLLVLSALLIGGCSVTGTDQTPTNFVS